MTYVALYRQWRPQRFADVVGQEHVVRTLRNALVHDRLAHAYLFCGPRGTGKTTAAKLLAKAVNCPNLQDGEPCNECPTCEQITHGRSIDVLEIDAASNRGIDEIRDLREKARYAPAECRRKVYIIDEVHMLTNEAFNALLKTLEEPPGHVLFVLATTDPQKVPMTILSRCQRFDFHRFAEEQISERLRLVLADRGVRIDEAGLSAIARAAEGGMRDALSLLDQVLAFSGSEVTLDDVLTVLGAAPLSVHLGLARQLAAEDAAAALATVASIVTGGQDLRQFLRDFMACLRQLMLISIGAGGEQHGYTPEEWHEMQETARLFRPGQLATLLRHLAEAEGDMRWSSQPRIYFELALVRSLEGHAGAVAESVPDGAAAPAGPARAPAKPPRQLAADPPRADAGAPPATAGAVTASAATRPSAAAPPGDQPGGAPPAERQLDRSQPAEAAAGGEPPTLATVQQRWAEVLDHVRNASRATEALLREGKPVRVDGWQVTVAFPAKFHFHRERVSRQRERQTVEAVLSRIFDGPCTLIVQADEAAADTVREQVLQDPLVQRVVQALDGEIVEIRGVGDTKGDGS